MNGSLFGNDTDTDMGPNGKTRWTAVLVNASGVPVATAPTGLTFSADGTFTYLTANGSFTFYYRIDTGTWTDGTTTADMSADSNVAMVTISVPPPPDSTESVVSSLTLNPLDDLVAKRQEAAGDDLGQGDRHRQRRRRASRSTSKTSTDLDEPDVTYAIGAPGLNLQPGDGRVLPRSAAHGVAAGQRQGRTEVQPARCSATDRQGNVGVGPTVSVTAHDKSK